MKKFFNLILLIILFLSTFIISCNYEEKWIKYEIKDLNKPIIDTLKTPNTEQTYYFEAIVRGSISGEAIIEFQLGTNNYYKKIFLQGNFSEKFETEWYENELIFKYTPLTEIPGDSIIIEYRML